MRLRLQQSAALVPHDAYLNARPLDKQSISSIIDRFDSIVGPSASTTEELKARISRSKKKNPVSAGIQDGLEKKLCQVIKDVQKLSTKYQSSGTSAAASAVLFTGASAAGGVGDSMTNTDTSTSASIVASLDDTPVVLKPKIRQHLTTRALLPYYKIEDVKNFMETFSKVDEDFSGDLDIDEWVKLFALLNENVPAQQARMIFMKVDDNQDGSISIRELVPIVFNKANKDQMKLIINHVESELVKKNISIVYMFPNEMEQLFECYDVGKIGFISVSTIRDRVRTFPLPESILFDFLDSISGVEDDEMVNQEEFLRLMKGYIGKPQK
jgi:Ca2+-binding EF-hand superfamily protein